MVIGNAGDGRQLGELRVNGFARPGAQNAIVGVMELGGSSHRHGCFWQVLLQTPRDGDVAPCEQDKTQEAS